LAARPLFALASERSMEMKILVTGGAGYIGSTTARLLLHKGHTVTILDNLSRGHRGSVPEMARFIEGDLADTKLLRDSFQEGEFDAVMHFAAFAEIGESMRLPELYFRNNTLNTCNLLDACLAHRVSRFVLSSTCAVFGDPQQPSIDESVSKNPLNPYGESKLQIERILAWYQKIHGIRYAVLRYFNAAGAWGCHGEHHDPESHLIPLILQVALGQRQAISIFGTDYPTPDGTCIRDFIHIYDLATAHLVVLDALRSESELIYNLGNGHGFSVREVIEVAREITGHPIPTEEAARRSGDPAILVAASDKIRRDLQWRPQHPSIEEIVRSAWEWHRAHPQGYERASHVAAEKKRG
jgi:UDP-glucose 4-epimerase